MIDPDRAVRAYSDVLAIEYDEAAEMYRVLTISDVYYVVPSEGQHLCPDREYHEPPEGLCKHLIASEVERGRIDAPSGWLVVDDFDERTDLEFELDTSELGAARYHDTLDEYTSDGGSNPQVPADWRNDGRVTPTHGNRCHE